MTYIFKQLLFSLQMCSDMLVWGREQTLYTSVHTFFLLHALNETNKLNITKKESYK